MYFENSTISKAFRDQNILTSMNFADGKVILIKNRENIQVKYMKKRIFWLVYKINFSTYNCETQ